MTDGPSSYSVIYFGSIDWGFRRQDHQFIGLALAARGHEVLYVENTGARWPRPRDLARVGARLRNWARGAAGRDREVREGIHLVSPLCIPGASFRVERALNQVLLRRQLRDPVRRLARPLVYWVGLPTWAGLDLVRWLRPALTVYYCGDGFTELPGLRPGIRDSERALLAHADIVFATSHALFEHCAALGATPILVPVAIDLEASRDAREGKLPVPPELRGLRGRLIGYMGGLNYKVDVQILDAIAERFRDDTIVILGSVEDARFRPRSAPNVVILGERPYEEIGAYLARFDVCLIPYRLNEYTAGVSPAKLLEYLAVGRPVVSTSLPEVLPYRPVVRIANDREEFLNAVAEALEQEEGAQERASRVRWAARNSYESVVADLVSRVERELAARAAHRG